MERTRLYSDCRYNGIMMLGNIIAANVREVELAPINIRIVSHLIKFSPKVEKLTIKDNITLDQTMVCIQTIISDFSSVQFLTIRHNSIICTCDLLKVSIEVYNGIQRLQHSPQIEIFVEMDRKYKNRTFILFQTFNCHDILDLGDSMRLSLTNQFRIIINFRHFLTMRRDLGNIF